MLVMLLCAALSLTACDNSPYPAGATEANTLYTAFNERSPRYLDPTSSYSSNETPYTYQIYEPLYGYHYLKRPYTLIPATVAHLPTPRYFDAQGVELPADASAERIARSVSRALCWASLSLAASSPRPARHSAAACARLWASWPLSLSRTNSCSPRESAVPRYFAYLRVSRDSQDVADRKSVV